MSGQDNEIYKRINKDLPFIDKLLGDPNGRHKAEALIKQHREKVTDHHFLNVRFIKLLRRTGREQEALSIAMPRIGESRDPMFYNEVGQCYLQLDKPDDALRMASYFHETIGKIKLPLQPVWTARCHELKAGAYLQQENYAAVFSECELATKANQSKKTNQQYILQAKAYLGMGEFALALQQVEAVLYRLPKNDDAVALASEASFRAGDWEKSLAYTRQLSGYHLDDFEVQMRLAETLLKLRQMEEANKQIVSMDHRFNKLDEQQQKRMGQLKRICLTTPGFTNWRDLNEASDRLNRNKSGSKDPRWG